MTEGPPEPAAGPAGARPEADGDDPVAPAGAGPRSVVHRLFIVGGAFGLAIALLVGLWVSRLHVRHSVIVQMEETWVPGRSVAVRSQLLDRELHGIEGVEVDVRMEVEGGAAIELGRLAAVRRSGVAQGRFLVPSAPLGPATVVLRYTAPSITSFEERVPIVVAAERKVRKPRHTVSGSTLQWADDTQPQPSSVRIVLRPEGRIVAGFVNRFVVRVTDPQGVPMRREVDVRLVDGELAGLRGDPTAPPRITLGATDDLGLLFFEGALASEVVRIDVRVLDEESLADATRTFRLVSYAGAVDLRAEPRGAFAGDPVTVRALALRARRPVFVDVFDAQGAWIDTLDPFDDRVLERVWIHPAAESGIVQFEGYHFTNNPGESTAVARVQLVDGSPDDPASLAPLVEQAKARLSLPHVERDFDAKLEAKYLDFVTVRARTPHQVARARRYLLGTLPVEVFGPPTALVTRPREEAALAARKHAWRIGLRIYLLGGGALFLVALSVSLVRGQRRLADATAAEMARDGDPLDPETVAALDRARRSVLLRGLGVVAVMACALVLTLAMLESLL